MPENPAAVQNRYHQEREEALKEKAEKCRQERDAEKIAKESYLKDYLAAAEKAEKYRQQRNALDRENKKLRARLRELGED